MYNPHDGFPIPTTGGSAVPLMRNVNPIELAMNHQPGPGLPYPADVRSSLQHQSPRCVPNHPTLTSSPVGGIQPRAQQFYAPNVHSNLHHQSSRHVPNHPTLTSSPVGDIQYRERQTYPSSCLQSYPQPILPLRTDEHHPNNPPRHTLQSLPTQHRPTSNASLHTSQLPSQQLNTPTLLSFLSPSPAGHPSNHSQLPSEPAAALQRVNQLPHLSRYDAHQHQPSSTGPNASQPSPTLSKHPAPKEATNKRSNHRAAPKPPQGPKAKPPAKATPASIVPLPNLQTKLKRAMDAEEKLARTKAVQAQKARARAAAKALKGAPADVPPGQALQPPARMNQASTLPALEVGLDFSGLDTRSPSPVEQSRLDGDHPAPNLNEQRGHDGRIREQPPNEDYMEDQDEHQGKHQDEQQYKGQGEGPDDDAHDPTFSSDEDGEDIRLANGNTRRHLRADLALELEAMAEDELRTRCCKYEHYTRLVAEDKADLDEATQAYHAAIFRIACKNRLQESPEDGESLEKGQRGKICGERWRQLTQEEKEAFEDPHYLAKLPNPYMELVLENGEVLPPCLPPGSSGGKPSKFDARRWCHKIAVDMVNLGNSHGVDRVVVVVHPTKTGQSLVTAGSRLGEAFLDILAKKDNPLDKFLEMVKGHRASCSIAGAEVPLPKRARQKKAAKNRMENCEFDMGGFDANRKPIRDQLGWALYKASNGSCTNGWPGKNTIQFLTNLKLSLRVDKNPLKIGPREFCKPISNMVIGEQERVLTALGKGWVHIVRHESVDPTEAIGHAGEDEEGTDVVETSFTVGPIPAGEALPNKTNQKKKASQKRAQASDKESTATFSSSSDSEEAPDDDRLLDNDFGMSAPGQSSRAGPSRDRTAAEDEEDVGGQYVSPQSPGSPPQGFPGVKKRLARAAKRDRAANRGTAARKAVNTRNEVETQNDGVGRSQNKGTQKGGGAQHGGGRGFNGPCRPKKIGKTVSSAPTDVA
ncbi:hypothetical protein MJO29_000789 [Puccinia striiformis f. sp. tritici]|nr:hypothetical protein MJO29_000789 [Puccinia striiformis f. sp. tritici]